MGWLALLGFFLESVCIAYIGVGGLLLHTFCEPDIETVVAAKATLSVGSGRVGMSVFSDGGAGGWVGWRSCLHGGLLLLCEEIVLS